MSPRGGDCDHGNCPRGDCQQLTEEEITPSPTDVAVGVTLATSGWYSVSTKYRAVARWRPEHEPPSRDTLAYALQGFPEPHRAYLLGLWECNGLSAGRLRTAPAEAIEYLELTIRQWRAFRAAGGRTA